MQKSLGLVFFPAFDWMISPTHPERKERLLYTRDQLTEEGIFDLPQITEYKPQLATMTDLERVHIGVSDLRSLITPAHLVSAGGCITAAESVIKGEVKRAFSLVRPPGHHAMRVVQGIRGFCTINIEAVMIEYLRQKYNIKKVAIVDTDVHHGDGTQDIYYHDPDTLFISFHQDGRTLYPGSGFTGELGSPYAYASTINLPLLPDTGDEGIHYLFDNFIRHILDDFKPDLIINSAGQDNHFTDPLASMCFTAQGYAKLADKLQANIAVLEGGYSILKALPYINTGIILAMSGLDYSHVTEPVLYQHKQPASCHKHIEKLITHMSDIWQNRDKLRAQELSKHPKTYSREKSIYYDESGIQEWQQETAHHCQHCHGLLSIISKTMQHTAFIVNISLGCCDSCYSKAYDLINTSYKQKKYDYYYLQDRRLDKLIPWHKNTLDRLLNL